MLNQHYPHPRMTSTCMGVKDVRTCIDTLVLAIPTLAATMLCWIDTRKSHLVQLHDFNTENKILIEMQTSVCIHLSENKFICLLSA